MIDASVLCPSCGEAIDLEVDEGGGSAQTYVEDCPVCCRPMQVRLMCDEEGELGVSVSRLDE